MGETKQEQLIPTEMHEQLCRELIEGFKDKLGMELTEREKTIVMITATAVSENYAKLIMDDMED